MKVSVIIPFYSNTGWLTEAIDSVLEQDYDFFEIIVVDDGSPEDLTAVEQRYKDGPIRFIHRQNGGPAAARNTGIANAQGEFLAFLDSDDVWMPGKLSSQISFMEANGYLWSHTGFLYWNYLKDTLSSRHTDISSNHDDVSLKSFVGFKVGMMTVVVARRVFDQHPEIRFDESLRICEDSDFFRQIAQYYPLGLIDRPLVKVRLTGSNTRLRFFNRFIAGAENHRRTKSGQFPYGSIPQGSMIRHIYAYYHLTHTLLLRISSPTLRDHLSLPLFAPIYLLERLYLLRLSSHPLLSPSIGEA